MRQFHSKASLEYLDSVNRELASAMSLGADLRAVTGKIVACDFTLWTPSEIAWFRSSLSGERALGGAK